MNACLHNKYSKKYILMLLSAGADLNIANNYGYTAAMFLAERGFTDLIKTLAFAGADLTVRNDRGETALDILKYRHPNKYKSWIKRNVMGARQKILNAEDSERSGFTPDFDI